MVSIQILMTEAEENGGWQLRMNVCQRQARVSSPGSPYQSCAASGPAAGSRPLIVPQGLFNAL